MELLLIVGIATCAAGRPRSVVDEVAAAVKEEAGPTPVGLVAPRRLDALQRCLADGGRGRAVQDNSGELDVDKVASLQEDTGAGGALQVQRCLAGDGKGRAVQDGATYYLILQRLTKQRWPVLCKCKLIQNGGLLTNTKPQK